MKIKIKLTKSQQELFENNASIVPTGDDEEYWYLPYWVKKCSDGTFDLCHFNNLPIGLTNLIKSQREENVIQKDREEFLRKYPRTVKDSFKDSQP